MKSDLTCEMPEKLSIEESAGILVVDNGEEEKAESCWFRNRDCRMWQRGARKKITCFVLNLMN